VELLGSSRVAGGPEVELTEPFLSCVTQAWHRTYCLRSCVSKWSCTGVNGKYCLKRRMERGMTHVE